MQQLRSLMVSNVEVVRPNSTLREAAKKMKRMNVGVLPVCDADRVVGIITDRDIVMRAVAESLNPDQTRANDIMTRDVLFCYEDQSIREAAERMQERKIGRLVVLSRDHRLKGIISLGNLSRHLGGEHFADFVVEKIDASERLGGFPRSRLLRTLGAVVGAATLVGGVIFLRRQGFEEERREAA